jgi:glycosyltransferase involved in cell wall biosynthesis
MKILVINSKPFFEKEEGLFLFKETGKFLEELNKYLEVHVFQLEMPAENSDFLANYNIKNKNIEIHTVKRNKLKYLAYFKALFVGFKAVCKIDFYYLFYPTNLFYKFFAIVSLFLGKRIGLYVRGEQRIATVISRFLYKRADVVLTISPKFTENIRKFNNNTYTIRPMIAYSEKDIVLDRQYKKKDMYELLFVGRIENAKGIFELAEAAKLLKNAGIRGFRFNLVGDGEDKETLIDYLKENGIMDLFSFSGTISDAKHLAEIYRRSDLFVFPSHHEGFPRVLYEAMILGTPIITTFVGSIPFLMKADINCYRIVEQNADDLASTIRQVLSNYEDCQSIAENAVLSIKNYLTDKTLTHAEQLMKNIQKKC